ncbi:hypothetical protein FHR71_005466 [Methylobacterium sp. RAS18]|nr:hypothetical protein [Methylobacterium sp. RAS18]
MSTREIVAHLPELYGIEVSADLISAVTDAVLEEVAAWQARPLEPVYPIVFFDALRIKVRDEGVVCNKAVHIALGVRADGSKEILGLWLEQNEGVKFWLRVMNELRNRGVEDVLLAVVDGLKGFPDAIQAVFPEALVQNAGDDLPVVPPLGSGLIPGHERFDHGPLLVREPEQVRHRHLQAAKRPPGITKRQTLQQLGAVHTLGRHRNLCARYRGRPGPSVPRSGSDVPAMPMPSQQIAAPCDRARLSQASAAPLPVPRQGRGRHPSPREEAGTCPDRPGRFPNRSGRSRRRPCPEGGTEGVCSANAALSKAGRAT